MEITPVDSTTNDLFKMILDSMTAMEQRLNGRMDALELIMDVMEQRLVGRMDRIERRLVVIEHHVGLTPFENTSNQHNFSQLDHSRSQSNPVQANPLPDCSLLNSSVALPTSSQDSSVRTFNQNSILNVHQMPMNVTQPFPQLVTAAHNEGPILEGRPKKRGIEQDASFKEENLVAAPLDSLNLSLAKRNSMSADQGEELEQGMKEEEAPKDEPKQQ